jgi:competence protein ComEA
LNNLKKRINKTMSVDLSPQQSRKRQKGLVVFTLLILGYIGYQFGVAGGRPDSAKKISLVSRSVTIEVNGLVHRPGIMRYDHPPLVQEAIANAGGVTQPHLLFISQRQEILDQDLTLTIREQDHGTVGFHRSPLSLKALWIIGRPIPVNRATVEDLSRLPGIGVKMAERIIVYREARGGFTSLDQLMEVKGIKEKTLAKIKGHFIL